MQAHDPVIANRKIGPCKDVASEEGHDSCVDLWPYWFHQIENQRRPARFLRVENSKPRIKSCFRTRSCHLALQDRIAEAEHRKDAELLEKAIGFAKLKGLRVLADRARMPAGHLSEILHHRRGLTLAGRTRLMTALVE
jgi:hypothetical protein